MKREFTLLAHKYDPHKYGLGGWFMSEKLDGMRALWDGGVTRGLPKSNVPWANNIKDGRYVTPPVATGLWSRYGNVIHAPDYFLDSLPHTTLDGELYAGKDNRQFLMSTVKDLEAGPGWEIVSLRAFDMPPPKMWLADGVIDTTNFHKTLSGCYDWYCKYAEGIIEYMPGPLIQYQTVVNLLKRECIESQHLTVHPQTRLPMATDRAIEVVDAELDRVSAEGGEGLIVRSDCGCWVGERSHYIQKVKKLDDAEGTVTGYVSGRETDKGSKLLGMMGALVLELDNGKRMELSGFTETERLLQRRDDITGMSITPQQWAQDNPAEECPDWIEAKEFPRGCKVTFKYRGLSRDKIPQEARYWRQYNG